MDTWDNEFGDRTAFRLLQHTPHSMPIPPTPISFVLYAHSNNLLFSLFLSQDPNTLSIRLVGYLLQSLQRQWKIFSPLKLFTKQFNRPLFTNSVIFFPSKNNKHIFLSVHRITPFSPQYSHISFSWLVILVIILNVMLSDL